MAVIKAHTPHMKLVEPVYRAFSLADIEQEAAAILEEASGRAAAIVEEAERSCDAERARAREEGLADGRAVGFAEGLREGREAGRREASEAASAELGRLASALSAAIAELRLAQESLPDAAAEDVARLAVAIATRVCGEVARRNPAACLHNVAAVLRLAGHARQVRLCVHPGDASAVSAVLSDLERQPHAAQVELIADAGIQPGGCRLHTQRGTVDAGLRSQLDRIAAELLCDPDDVP